MLVASVASVCAAAVLAVLGARGLARPARPGSTQQVLRSVAPTQLAAAAMLTAGALVALSGGPAAWLLVASVIGAVFTVTAGIWRGARYAQAGLGAAPATGCPATAGEACASCKLSCD